MPPDFRVVSHSRSRFRDHFRRSALTGVASPRTATRNLRPSDETKEPEERKGRTHFLFRRPFARPSVHTLQTSRIDGRDETLGFGLSPCSPGPVRQLVRRSLCRTKVLRIGSDARFGCLMAASQMAPSQPSLVNSGLLPRAASTSKPPSMANVFCNRGYHAQVFSRRPRMSLFRLARRCPPGRPFRRRPAFYALTSRRNPFAVPSYKISPTPRSMKRIEAGRKTCCWRGRLRGA